MTTEQAQLFALLFGVLAVGLMILALVVMLQGVFEQKMPV